MKEQIQKAIKHNQIVDIIYMAKDSTITKRRIKMIKVVGESFQAYCFVRHAKRTFKIDNVLAIYPPISKLGGLNA